MADPYLQASGTLLNKLGIRDSMVLQAAEIGLVAVRLAALDVGQGPTLTKDCLSDLKSVHAFVFQDLYPWAGKTRAEPFVHKTDGRERTVQTGIVIAKGKKVFASPQDIAPRLDQLSLKMKEANSFKGIKRRDFIIAIADFLSEINDVHAFREGNGRVQRAYIEMIARRADRSIDFRPITREWMIQASVAADSGNLQAMRRLIRDGATPERAFALNSARNQIEQAGFKDLNDRYIGFVEPGHRHHAKLVAISRQHFTCVVGNSTILIGWRKDLPRPDIKPGEIFTFVGQGAPTATVVKRRSGLEI